MGYGDIGGEPGPDPDVVRRRREKWEEEYRRQGGFLGLRYPENAAIAGGVGGAAIGLAVGGPVGAVIGLYVGMIAGHKAAGGD